MDKFFFRYTDRATDEGHQMVRLERYRLVRLSETGKTAWVQPGEPWMGEPLKRFCPGAHRPWAHDTPEEAWAAYRRRKHWQVGILQDRLKRATACYLAAQVELSTPPLTPLTLELPQP